MARYTSVQSLCILMFIVMLFHHKHINMWFLLLCFSEWRTDICNSTMRVSDWRLMVNVIESVYLVLTVLFLKPMIMWLCRDSPNWWDSGMLSVWSAAAHWGSEVQLFTIYIVSDNACFSVTMWPYKGVRQRQVWHSYDVTDVSNMFCVYRNYLKNVTCVTQGSNTPVIMSCYKIFRF